MSDIRINALASTATTPASDDYLALDGSANGTRKILATNIANNVSDVILGASGPSVKSTLSARAPRQGLVFDGTTGSTGTLGSIPSGTWSVSAVIDVPTSNPASNIMALTMGIGYGVAGGGSFILGDINSSGELNVSQWAGTYPAYRQATISGFRAAYSGKRVHLAAVVTGAALTIYINGVATSYTETSGAGAPAWGDTLGSANVFVGKGQSALYYFSGGIYAPLIYNRALSASEVVALYEAGAPSGADYNNASNTALNGAAFTNGNFTTFTSASATGFTATNTSGAEKYAQSNNAFAVTLGQRIRVTYSLSGTGTVSAKLAETGVQNLSSPQTLTAGTSQQVTFVVTTASANCVLHVTSAGSTDNFTLSSVNIDRPGLLLAPDAAQAGGGLVWYDTSGNAANITLPASGVSWNVPSSRYLGGNWTTSGNLTVSGGQALTVGSSANYSLWKDGTPTKAGRVILNNTVTNGLSLGLYDGSSWVDTLHIHPTNNNVLIGTTTDGGQKLQVSGTGLFSSGSTTTLEVKSTGSDAQHIVNAATGGAASTIYKVNGSLVAQEYVTSASGYQIYGPSSFLAYTLNPTNGNATFAGSIAIGNTVQTAAAIASTHKVTISIGGVTYYLLATNV